MYKFLVFLEFLAQMKLCKVNSILSFSFIFFRCNKGYTLEGEKESSCLASGSWSQSPPVCELVKCSSPEDVNHGNYILSGLTYLSTASYSCDNGYRYSPRQQSSFLWYSVTHYLLNGFHFHVIAAAAAKSLQSCPTLCNPRDGSPPGSPVPGILQARTLEWVAISSSNA